MQTVLEDDKYTYEMAGECGLTGFGIKSSDFNKYYKVKGNLSESDAEKKAEQYLNKYAKEEDVKYTLVDNTRKSDDAQDIYMLKYQGATSNGIRTGDFVMIWLNLNGEVVNFAQHKGNKDTALNSKPQISEKDAQKIAMDKVLSGFKEEDKQHIPKLAITSVLTINDGKLVYEITISAGDKGLVFPTYCFHINSQNRYIEYQDVAG